MSTSDSLTPTTKKKSSPLPNQCRICDAPASWAHFGVISCDSCRIFFRRYANNQQRKFTCRFDGHCEINVNTRHVCIACRLVKCLQCGMSTELFRASLKGKSSQKSLIKYQPKMLPTLNLLRSDSSSLTTNQWNHLSNLINSFQESQLLAIGQRLMQANNAVQSAFNTLSHGWLTCCYETTGRYLRLNHDLCQLPTDDRTIMLRNAANTISCVSSSLVLQHYPLYNLNMFVNLVISMCGKEAIDVHQWGMKFMDSDIIVVKLGFSLFAFSEITYSYYPHAWRNLTDPLSILKVQNQYADITWKYLLYRYGHYQAVQRFLNLICWINAESLHISYIQKVSLHVNDVNTIAEDTELKLVLDDVDDILEMNQTSN